MAKNKDGGGGGGEGARRRRLRRAAPRHPAPSSPAQARQGSERDTHRGAASVRGRERERERLGRPGREAYPHLIQLTGAIWQLLAR